MLGFIHMTNRLPTVVLIDHHRARFFEAKPDGRHFEEHDHLVPKDPHGFERHLEHRKEAHYKGERTPEPTEYYERIAERLKGAPAIVLIGDGTGKSSAMEFLAAYLKKKHTETAARIVRTADADLSSITLPKIDELALSEG
jgi:hypothetical protein